jgi:hypothetical protein
MDRLPLIRIPGGFILAFLLARALSAQPAIEHGDLSCLPRGEFTEFVAGIEPASTIRAAKLYFRSDLYKDFYFVSMSQNQAGAFTAVMPMPSEETTRIVYYIEAVDVSFQTTRSDDFAVDVSSDSGCRRGPFAAPFSGSPAIVVGATQLGAAAIPAGFQAAGIAGFMTASGGVAAAGGGIGVGVAVGAAAGAAAGVGVLVAGGGDGATTTTTSPPFGGGGTSSASTSTTTSTPAATTTSPSGSTTTTAGSTSSTPSGPSPSTTTTTTIPTLTACFEWRALGNCKVFFDSCSMPANDITRYEWRMLGPPVPEPPLAESFTFDFTDDPRCRGSKSFNHPVRHTVFDRYGRKASVQQNVTVRPAAAVQTENGRSATLAFQSRLAAPPMDGRARGLIVVNGAILPAQDNSSPSKHSVRVDEGVVRIELTLQTAVAPGSLWELDFSASAALVPGSVRAETGMVASAEDRRIVLRLNGDRGESLRIRLEVR